MTEDLSIICTGDLHLGRHPTRIPEDVDGPEFSPKTIWRDTVEVAIRRGVDLVLVSGDIIDEENSYFEAYGPFEDGVRQLEEAGVETLVVSGNHDSTLLPRLVSNLDSDLVHCLGEGGTWERHTIDRDGHPLVHIDGWSFPDSHVRKSPLAAYDPATTPADEPVIGLLHADLDAPESEYAPVASDDLEGTTADAWLLGHIHTPGVRAEADPMVLYPGSPQPLDPGESGLHGVWLLERNVANEFEVEQLPIATVQYDEIEIDVTGLQDTRDLPGMVTERLKQHVETEMDSSAVRLLCARLRLVGETPAHGSLVHGREMLEADMAIRVAGLEIRVDKLNVETRSEVDLEELATEPTPVGYLARLLLELEADDQAVEAAGDKSEIEAEADGGTASVAPVERGRLVSEATEAVREVRSAGAYTPLRRAGRQATDDTAPPDEIATDVLRRQTRLLLHELLSQTEEES